MSSEKKIYDVKFLSMEEFRRKLFFDYGIEAQKYLRDAFNLSIANGKEVLENLCYVDSAAVYGDEKLDTLAFYKKKLEEKGLLLYDPLFRESLKGRKIFVLGYGDLPKEEKQLINGEVIAFEESEKVYELSFFHEMEEEVIDLYERIRKLIYEQGVDINRIFVLSTGRDYVSFFRRYNTCYPFSIEVKDESVLAGCAYAKQFLSMIDTSSREEIYVYFAQKKDEVSQKMIAILNTYARYDLKEVKDFIADDLSKIRIHDDEYRDLVACVDLFHVFKEDDYVFLPGFNDSFPCFEADLSYLSDVQRHRLHLSDTGERNALLRRNVKAFLSSIPHLHLSFCENSPFSHFGISTLLPGEDYVLKKEELKSDQEAVNRSRLSQLLDQYYRYGVHDRQLDVLYRSLPDYGYRQYDHRFKGLMKDQISEYGGLNLSYSSMDRYYRCAFSFYLSMILKADPFDETFFTRAGSLIHGVLKDFGERKDFDFDQSWKYHKERYFCDGLFESGAERYFLERFFNETKEDIAILKKQNEWNLLDSKLCEETFRTKNAGLLPFKGMIDRVNYLEKNSEVLVEVVDYKTGKSDKVKRKLWQFGMNLQLPSYMYLLSRDNVFDKKLLFGGFYLQHLLNYNLNYDEKRDRRQVKEESMKLYGFSSADKDRLELCDAGVGEGEAKRIGGLRFKKNGEFYSSSRLLSDEETDALIENVEGLIRDASKGILQGDFAINPKEIDGKNESCAYCGYRDICYRRFSDIRRYSTKEGEQEDA